MLLKIKTQDYITHYNSSMELHRDNDLSAVIWSNGSQCWFQDGKLHRDNDLPAVVYVNGMREWYKDGKPQRNHDLPVDIYPRPKYVT